MTDTPTKTTDDCKDGKDDNTHKSNGQDGPVFRRATPEELEAEETQELVDVSVTVRNIIKETGGYLLDVGGIMVRANEEDLHPHDHHQTIQALLMINAHLSQVATRLVVLRLIQERRDQRDQVDMVLVDVEHNSGDLESPKVSPRGPKGDLKGDPEGAPSESSLLGADEAEEDVHDD